MPTAKVAVHVVVVFCKVDPRPLLRPLCNSPDTRIFAYDKCGVPLGARLSQNCSSLTLVRADNHGRDFKVYLTHIIEHYAALPESLFFIHDDYSKHMRLSKEAPQPPPFFAAENWRKLAGCYGFLTLKHPCLRQELSLRAPAAGAPARLCQRYSLGLLDPADVVATPSAPNRVNTTAVAGAMHDIASALLPSLPSTYSFFENAQYLIAGTRLRRQPLAWYRRALAFVATIGLSFDPIYAFERLWHLFFGCASSACLLGSSDADSGAGSGGACSRGHDRVARWHRMFDATSSIARMSAAERAAALPAPHVEEPRPASVAAPEQWSRVRCRTCAEAMGRARLGQLAKYEKQRLCQLATNPTTRDAVPRNMRSFCRSKLGEQRTLVRDNLECAHFS